MPNPIVTSADILAEAEAPSGALYEFMGLPVHPLVVHVAVVMLPLAALGLIGIFAIPALRRRIGWLVIIGLVIGTGGVYVAYESGEQLAAAIGLPERHAELAEQVKAMAFVLLGVGLLWYVVARFGDRRQARMAASAARSTAAVSTEPAPSGPDSPKVGAAEPGASASTSSGIGSSKEGSGKGSVEVAPTVRYRQSTLALILGVVMVIVASLNLVWIVLVGHSGAEAVWAGELPESGQSASPQSSASASGTAAAAATSYSMSDVAAHATSADCWSVVDSKVYNLTSWQDKHPGGKAPIEGLCGNDATAAFRGQHANSAEPNDVLAGFQIGVLASATGQPTVANTAGPSSNGSSGAYTMAEVKAHDTPEDCWAVVENAVYELTDWVERHPGGAAKIKRLCGEDASAMFSDEHGGQMEPNSALADFQIGALAG